MPTVHEKLDALAEALADKGDDGQRLELVQRARRFKRSWLEMAEALLWVRDTAAFERWGYKDLHEYCRTELHIRPATVDKLTGSYRTLREHAPQVLQRDGVAQEIPTVEAVDYFAQALDPSTDRRPRKAPKPEVVEELKAAVFEENKPVAVLRREFNPVIRPKPAGADELERMEKTMNAGRRLEKLLPDVDEVSEETKQRLIRALGPVLDELSEAIELTRDRVYPESAA